MMKGDPAYPRKRTLEVSSWHQSVLEKSGYAPGWISCIAVQSISRVYGIECKEDSGLSSYARERESKQGDEIYIAPSENPRTLNRKFRNKAKGSVTNFCAFCEPSSSFQQDKLVANERVPHTPVRKKVANPITSV